MATEVGIIMGSQSDWPTMKEAATLLDELGVPYEAKIVSAHRTPDRLWTYGKTAAERGLKVIIAGAGGAAHLPGMMASKTRIPVIGVPVQTRALSGVDSLYSIVQMPRGFPVATMAIGAAGAANAGLMAAAILALNDPALAARLDAWRAALSASIRAPGMSRIGFIGTGHIAAPMVRFLAAKGHDIIVTNRSAAIAAQLVQDCGVDAGDAQDVIDGSDVVFLCLRPNQVAAGLTPLTFRAEQQIVSVMAGVDLVTLRDLCAPVRDITRTIPLGFLERGGCPLATLGNDTLLASLFAPENPVVAVADEAALNAHFAICALVPGLLDLMSTGAGWLASRTGNPQAEFFTSQLVSGFLAAMDKDLPGQLAVERDALATDGTLSLQMTDALRVGGAHDALAAALSAINNRLETK